MLVVMALGGYIISRGKGFVNLNVSIIVDKIYFCLFFFSSIDTDRVPKWWIWGFWFSPLMYAQNAASVNEFHGHSWDKVKP